MGLSAYCYRFSGMLVGYVLAGCSLVISSVVFAQNTDDRTHSPADASSPLDPDKPLTEFPDFGVEWPDLDDALRDETPSDDVEAQVSAHDMEMDRRLSEDEIVAEVSGTTDSERQDAARIAVAAEDYQPEDALAEQDYGVRLVGLPENLDEIFYDRFKQLSALEKYKGDEANFAQIKRRAETDIKLVEQLLHIEGYYDATVRSRFGAGKTGDIAVTIAVTAGPQYKLDDISLPGLELAQGDDPQQLRRIFGLESGDIVDSDAIAQGRARLDNEMAENGYAFAKTHQPELIIDHESREGDLKIVVAPGGKYVFGSIIMPNTELFGPEHAALIARFDEGDLYNRSDVEDLRQALIATGLVSTVNLEPVVSETRREAVDLLAEITPAPLRTISGALGYGTSEGLRSEISWEHRNLFPPEGLIRLTGVMATQEQSGSVTFRRNNYRRRDNVLNGQLRLSNINNPAYEARTFAVSANIERQSNLILQKKWNWSLGIELLASQERDISGNNQTTKRNIFFIGALPATLTYDGSDDLLNPSTGFRLGARISPEASLQAGSFYYIRSQFDSSVYYPASEKIILAGRARVATITGAGRNRIAPSRRLYSGGGGSVRGFGYQQIGPRDINNDPLGGRSLVELSLEARVRLDMLGGNFGVVPFIDAGNVYRDSIPDFDGLRFGTGLGVRYYSDFGPIRVDVGTPINPQPGDSRIAVYVSLGQAF
ncbi:BamA/TamA family outer membrane protein [Parasphingorhabdus sp. JC815]|uniref:autotransporter assembly complex protein TamA n=1 Tax=Parasphingorhabdus sp. JC815 TaxID=3232140 RepID=UPI0034584020